MTEPISAENISDMLKASDVPAPERWDQTRIFGYAVFLNEWIARNSTETNPTLRQTQPRDDLDKVRDAISTLRTTLPKIRELREPIYRIVPKEKWNHELDYLAEIREWQLRCDRLSKALLHIPKKYTPPTPWHLWAIDIANAFAGITGIETISRAGPGGRFLKAVLMNVYNYDPSLEAIEEAIANFRTDSGWWRFQMASFAHLLTDNAIREGFVWKSSQEIFSEDGPPSD